MANLPGRNGCWNLSSNCSPWGQAARCIQDAQFNPNSRQTTNHICRNTHDMIFTGHLKF